MPVARVRLDSLLAERGLFESRTRAAAAVIAGQVHLGPGRRRAEKPGQLVDAAIELEVDGPPPYVSRGGVKLANALDTLGLDPRDRHALDVGASTGGFTDCLLQRGAAHVIALDVAYGELDYRLREDERVTVIERTNARAITADELPYRPDLVVIDVSFISLRKVLPAVLATTADAFDCLAMVKPQFEVGQATGSARAASSRTRSCGARSSTRSPPRPASSAPRCSAARRRRCPARPATRRPSCGSPTARAPVRSTRSRHGDGRRADHPPPPGRHDGRRPHADGGRARRGA